MEISRKYYAFLAISAILLMGSLGNVPDVYAEKPMSIDVIYKNSDASGSVFMEVKKGTSFYNTDPCDAAATPCNSGLTVTHNQVFTVLPISGTTLESETQFFIGTNELFFGNKEKDGVPKTPLHTSCSAPLGPGTTGSVTISFVTHTIIVVDVNGGDKQCESGMMIGGHGGITDKTSLIVAGAQVSSSWMIPLLVSAVGIGIFVVSYKKE